MTKRSQTGKRAKPTDFDVCDVTLAPLSTEDALRGLLKVKLDAPPKRGRKAEASSSKKPGAQE